MHPDVFQSVERHTASSSVSVYARSVRRRPVHLVAAVCSMRLLRAATDATVTKDSSVLCATSTYGSAPRLLAQTTALAATSVTSATGARVPMGIPDHVAKVQLDRVSLIRV